ncbi:DUF2844 domain-containing protein [Paraburkholderia sp. LEh10]|jgi:hypothetical protein|uniref:DUF2844 domain-containing protein n=1 Tax=Paraburkholderia sp. LEh10 TaxID=2821353 RepID=UPI001AE84213|nr:DUF2844 domain-containing protein [Paraburkholderia sp. LEh10]MBP0591417.1 DUF2844 domain-containing protein [Paraburkholderia sp. LEh10]
MKSIRIVAALALLSPVVCHATLGAAPSPSTGARGASPASRAALTAAIPSAPATPYSVHESQTADGVTIREYVSAANVVFAVTWQGPTRPDMQALLGSYFPNLVAAGQRAARGTGPLIVREGELRIESVGHQGAFAGKAYVPRLVPANVNVDDLQ